MRFEKCTRRIKQALKIKLSIPNSSIQAHKGLIKCIIIINQQDLSKSRSMCTLIRAKVHYVSNTNANPKSSLRSKDDNAMSHPKFEVWSARGKHTPMPPKPWPPNYLLKFRHNLTRLGRLPTCKIRKPLTRIHHTTCTQTISIINYKFTYITSKCIQHYQSSTKYLCDVDYNNIIHDKRNNTRCP